MGLVVKSSAGDLDGIVEGYLPSSPPTYCTRMLQGLSGGLESLGDSCTIAALFSLGVF